MSKRPAIYLMKRQWAMFIDSIMSIRQIKSVNVKKGMQEVAAKME